MCQKICPKITYSQNCERFTKISTIFFHPKLTEEKLFIVRIFQKDKEKKKEHRNLIFSFCAEAIFHCTMWAKWSYKTEFEETTTSYMKRSVRDIPFRRLLNSLQCDFLQIQQSLIIPIILLNTSNTQ